MEILNLLIKKTIYHDLISSWPYVLYTNIFREKKESFKVRVPLFAWGCIWCIDTVTLSQDALYIAQSAAVTLHPQILSPASSIMVTSQGNAGSIDTQGVSDLDLAHTLSILVLKWWDFSLSLIIFKQERYLVLHLAQSGLSQHLLDAHRMAREREGQILRHQATNLTERQWQPSAELWAGHTPFVRGEWEREDDARLRGDGKTLPTIIILQQVWHHLYLSPATRQTAASHGSWTVFLLCYYFFISQHLFLFCLLQCYTY